MGKVFKCSKAFDLKDMDHNKFFTKILNTPGKLA